MALTISIDGKGVIANCDALTNDTGGTGTGDWSEVGGGAMTLTTDVFLYGNSCIAGKYAGKSGFQQFDLGAGNELDFSVGGNESGQSIFMWVNLATFGVLNTLGNAGLAIRLSSASPGTSDYADYVIAGSDGANGWSGGWKLFVIDPDITPTRTSGTFDKSAVRTLGIWIDTVASVRAESIFIDQIAVGRGIQVYGTSTEGWKDIVDYCTDYANRAWGMWQEREGIYYTYGSTRIGNYNDQTADVSFKDSSRIIQVGESEFYNSSGVWVTSIRAYRPGLEVDDSPSYKTEFEDGVLVGTDGGRSGSTIIGNDTVDYTINFLFSSKSTSQLKLYNTAFKRLYGGISLGLQTQYLFYGGSVVECGTFNPYTTKLRNVIVSEAKIESNVAMAWHASSDIEDCKFIANTYPASPILGAIYHAASGEIDYNNLEFSGNDIDIKYAGDANQETVYEWTNGDTDVPMGASYSLRQAQTFTVGASAVTLTYAKFYMQKVGSPTGNAIAKLYATSGGAPTGAALATSETLDVADFATFNGWRGFEFKDLFEMQASTVYAIAVEYSGGDGSNYITTRVDGSSPSHAGTGYAYVSSWVSQSYDHIMAVHEGGILIINNLGSSNAATYTLLGTPGAIFILTSIIQTLTGLAENTEITYTKKPTPYDSLTGVAFIAGSRTALDILASWTTDEFKGKLLVVSTAGDNQGRYYVTGNSGTEIFLSKPAPATGAVDCDIYGAFDIIDHTESVPASGINTYNYQYVASTYVDILIFHVDYEDIVLEDILLADENASIPIVQIPDVNYLNP